MPGRSFAALKDDVGFLAMYDAGEVFKGLNPEFERALCLYVLFLYALFAFSVFFASSVIPRNVQH